MYCERHGDPYLVMHEDDTLGDEPWNPEVTVILVSVWNMRYDSQ